MPEGAKWVTVRIMKAIEFHNCQTDDERAALCVLYLAKFYEVSNDVMAMCCNLAPMMKPEVRPKSKLSRRKK